MGAVTITPRTGESMQMAAERLAPSEPGELRKTRFGLRMGAEGEANGSDDAAVAAAAVDAAAIDGLNGAEIGGGAGVDTGSGVASFISASATADGVPSPAGL